MRAVPPPAAASPGPSAERGAPPTGGPRAAAVVVGVVALCLALVCGSIALFQRSDGGPGTRRRLEAIATVQDVGERVLRYRARAGRLPSRLEEICIDDGAGARSEQDLIDPWGRPLLYAVLSPDRFQLRSLGADGAPGGRGEDSDIVWAPEPASPTDR